MKTGLRIVYYHLISNVALQHYPAKATLSVKYLVEQLKYFKKKYEIITLGEAINRVDSGFKFHNQLIVTTDDGFSENFKIVGPILDDLNISAVHFLINSCIDNHNLMWRHAHFIINNTIKNGKELRKEMFELANNCRLLTPLEGEDLMSWSLRVYPNNMKDVLTRQLWGKLMKCSIRDYLDYHKPYLSTQQIKDLISNGNEIGSHTKTHPIMSILTKREILDETISSVHELSAHFRTKVISFSFPFGRDVSVIKALEGTNNPLRVMLGTRESMNSNKGNPMYWERTNMEFNVSTFPLLFHLNPLKESFRMTLKI